MYILLVYFDTQLLFHSDFHLNLLDKTVLLANRPQLKHFAERLKTYLDNLEIRFNLDKWSFRMLARRL